MGNMAFDLSVNLAGLKLSNPIMTCSGTSGYAFEYADFMDLSRLGAFVTKSITREERQEMSPHALSKHGRECSMPSAWRMSG